MAALGWRRWIENRSVSRRRQKRASRQGGKFGFETLESRLALTVSTWSGAVSDLWSDPGNWNVPPAPGNDLVFPAGATSLTSTDDLAAGTSFGSLTIGGSGYTIGGNAITLTGTLDSAQTGGSNTVGLPIAPGGDGPLSVTVDESGADLVLSGAVSGSTGLTKSGDGVLDLTGANTYTGTTPVSAGVLDVDTAQASSPVALAVGTTLGGAGTVGTITATSATVSPGNPAPGVLTDNGDLNLDSGSSVAVALDGTTPGTAYSQLVVAGQVNLGGATLNATAGFTPSGNDSFTIIDNTGSSAVNGTFAGLPQGATVMISGQPYSISYTGGDGNDVVLTSQAASATSLSPSSSSIVAGQPITLAATVASADPSATSIPTGTVEFFDGPTSLGTSQLTDGMASLPNVFLPLGTGTITAQYQGDGNFTSSTSPGTSVIVSQASTSTSLTAAPNPVTNGTAVTLTATVAAVSPGTGTPTGSVEFFSGSTSLGTETLDSTGVATMSTAALAVGSDSITATYQGDTSFTQSTSPAETVTVNLASTTSLTASPTSFSSGQTIALNAVVTAASGSSQTATGTVNFLNGSTTLGSATLDSSGTAVLSVSTLTATTTLTAQYLGDSNFAGSTSSGVTVRLVQPSTTTLTIAPNPAPVGQPVTLAAAVTSGAGVPTGTIMFLNGSIPLGVVALDSTGSGILAVTSLPAGSDSITAQYSGDDSSGTSASSAVVETVTQANATTTLSATPSSSTAGQAVTLSVNVAAAAAGAPTPTGTITFMSGTTTLGTSTLDVDGNADLTTSDLPEGSSTIMAQYSGDSNYFTSTSSPVTLSVSPGSSTSFGPAGAIVTLSLSSTNPGAYTSVQLTASVAPASAGDVTPTGMLFFTADFQTIGSAALDDNGNATFSTSDLDIGDDAITAVYAGDSNYAASATNPTSIVVGTSDERFVNEIYLGVLERPAEQAGLEDWTNALADGMSRNQVVKLIMNSPEARALGQAAAAAAAASSSSSSSAQNNAPQPPLTARSAYSYKVQRINTMYQEILGRPADPTGLQYFIGVIDQGYRPKEVIIDLLASDEFYTQFTGQEPS
jgi:autotransporter-associated beta strand protein